MEECLVRRSDEFDGEGQFQQPACDLCLENIFALVIIRIQSASGSLSDCTVDHFGCLEDAFRKNQATIARAPLFSSDCQ